MQSGRHSFYCTLELSCPHDNLSAIPPATKVAGFLASFYEKSNESERQSRVGEEIIDALLGDVNNETIGHANLKNRSERTESLKRK